MRFLEALASAFIDTFGITQPKDEARRRAAWYIVGLLTILLAALVAAGALIFHTMRTSK